MLRDVLKPIASTIIKGPLYKTGAKNFRKLERRVSSAQYHMSLQGIQSRKRLATWQNKHAGERAFVIGNGPSLNLLDLTLLKDEVSIGCNGLFILFDNMGFVPPYYTCEDKLVGEDRARELNNLKGTNKVFPYDLRHFLKSDEDTTYVNFIRGDYVGYPRISTDFANEAYWGGTVTFLNLQLAIHLGCTTIYMIGFDHNYVLPDEIRTNEIDNNVKKVIHSKEADINHFDPSYFGPGYRWHNPNVARMERSYVVARKFAEANNIKIYNATIGGKLEVFERVDYSSLF
ncbi:MAG: 6-hydroxymethylpterin diphosphokinase MptE-like protein [Chloroflexota bacterium]